jgi:hypothetical protein
MLRMGTRLDYFKGSLDEARTWGCIKRRCIQLYTGILFLTGFLLKPLYF